MVAPKKKISAIVTLLFMAPFVAEYLLGDLPLKLLPVMLFMAPMYGGGAILIREVTRRMGRGWPTMLGLSLAYMLIEEGLVTQSLFNHDYLKMHMHLLDPAYLPALGIGGWWTLLMVNLHVFWSMGVSIALVEALYPADADAPWMGVVGDSVVGVFFVLGTLANFGIGLKQNQFEASHAQLGERRCIVLADCGWDAGYAARTRRSLRWHCAESMGDRAGYVADRSGRDARAFSVGLGRGGCDVVAGRWISYGRVDPIAASGLGRTSHVQSCGRWGVGVWSSFVH